MDGLNDPATETQLNVLRQFHYEPDHELSRVEAAQLIGNLRRRKESGAMLVGTRSQFNPVTEPECVRLHSRVEEARQDRAMAGINRFAECDQVLAAAICNRQDFWMDSCRDPVFMQTHTPEVREFYVKFGCRFVVPTREQVQEVLDALDSALPGWEGTHVELFYQTLELNFPALLRHMS